MINKVIVMKNIRKKLFLYLKILILIVTAVICLVKTDIISSAVSDALDRCLNTIIPSLYAMMIMSSLLIKSGITGVISKFTGGIGKIFFGMERIVLPVFTFSMFAGYPVGTKMLCSAYENGLIEKRRAEIFCGLCFGAGPAFIFGCISGQLYGSPSAGNIILVSVVGANIILALLVSVFMRKKCRSEKITSEIKLSADMITDCVISGGRSMADICFMVIAFSVVTEIMNYFGIISAVGVMLSKITHLDGTESEQLIRAVMDVTAVNGFTYGNYALLPYLSSLVSFGGICVIFQISAVTSGKLSLKPLIVMRTASAVISFFICRIITPFMLSDETVFTSSLNVRTHQAHSPVPSVMLIIMTFVLFCEYEKIKTLRQE